MGQGDKIAGMTINAWTQQIFEAKGFREEGKPVRRKVSSVKRYSSEDELKAACEKYGAALLKNGDQYVILPNPDVTILYKA